MKQVSNMAANSSMRTSTAKQVQQARLKKRDRPEIDLFFLIKLFFLYDQKFKRKI